MRGRGILEDLLFDSNEITHRILYAIRRNPFRIMHVVILVAVAVAVAVVIDVIDGVCGGPGPVSSINRMERTVTSTIIHNFYKRRW